MIVPDPLFAQMFKSKDENIALPYPVYSVKFLVLLNGTRVPSTGADAVNESPEKFVTNTSYSEFTPVKSQL
jgi:hypothetical protein